MKKQCDQDNYNDRMSIEQQMKNYAWGLDRKDIDLWMSIWSEDAVYDLTNLGYGTIDGLENLKHFMNFILFPAEPMLISFISNIDINFTGDGTAEGSDYYFHKGYVPVDVKDPSIKFSPANPDSWYLMQYLIDNKTNPLTADKFAFVRDHKEGQHIYKFVKENDDWKISYLKGLSLFRSTEQVGADSNEFLIDQRPNEKFYTTWLSTAGCSNKDVSG